MPDVLGGPELVEAIDELSAGLSKKFKDAFIRAVTEMLDGPVAAALARYRAGTISHGALGRALADVRMPKDELLRLVDDGVRETVRVLADGVGFDQYLIDTDDPDFLQRIISVTETLDDLEDSIRATLTSSLGRTSGMNRDVVARRIVDEVGLHPRYAQAVENYRQGLLNRGYVEDRIDRLSRQYANRLMESRADTIGRTMGGRVAGIAERQTFRQLSDAGLVPEAVYVWVTASDERVCEICRPMDGSVIPMGGMWMTSAGPVEIPAQVHPNCRCGVLIRFPEGNETLWKNVSAEAGARYALGAATPPKRLVIEPAPVDEQGDWAWIAKYNPYRDELGRFTDAAHAVMILGQRPARFEADGRDTQFVAALVREYNRLQEAVAASGIDAGAEILSVMHAAVMREAGIRINEDAVAEMRGEEVSDFEARMRWMANMIQEHRGQRHSFEEMARGQGYDPQIIRRDERDQVAADKLNDLGKVYEYLDSRWTVEEAAEALGFSSVEEMFDMKIVDGRAVVPIEEAWPKYLKDQAQQLDDLVQRSKVAVRVQYEDTDAILRSGQLATIHTSDEAQERSIASWSTHVRRRIEQGVFVDSAPTYGHIIDYDDQALTPEDKESMGWRMTEMGTALSTYGGVNLVLKDEVKSRTSYSFGDSFSAKDDEVFPTVIGEPSPASMFTPPEVPMTSATTVRQAVESTYGVSYIEAQIHGRVALSDVEEIRFDFRPPTTVQKRWESQGVKVSWEHPRPDWGYEAEPWEFEREVHGKYTYGTDDLDFMTLPDGTVVPLALSPEIGKNDAMDYEVQSRLLEEDYAKKLAKFNPYHDERGRFTTADRAVTLSGGRPARFELDPGDDSNIRLLVDQYNIIQETAEELGAGVTANMVDAFWRVRPDSPSKFEEQMQLKARLIEEHRAGRYAFEDMARQQGYGPGIIRRDERDRMAEERLKLDEATREDLSLWGPDGAVERAQESIRAEGLEQARQLDDLVQRSKIAVRVGYEDVDAILRSGQLGTIHTSAESKERSINPDTASMRRTIESKVYVDSAPTYGHVVDADDQQLTPADPEWGFTGAETMGRALETYGSVNLVLKDSVKSRTTYTYGDSIGVLHDQMFPTLVGEPSPAAFREGHRYVELTPASTVREAVEYGGVAYIEAQVHGRVTLGDVEEIRFDYRPPETVQARWEGQGIKVSWERGEKKYAYEDEPWAFEREYHGKYTYGTDDLDFMTLPDGTVVPLALSPEIGKDDDRFWAKVDRKGKNGCWVWGNAKNRKGYGQFWHDGKVKWAHRHAWEISGKKLPEGMQLDHKCRTPGCVNPAHLELVSLDENRKRQTDSMRAERVGKHKTGHDERDHGNWARGIGRLAVARPGYTKARVENGTYDPTIEATSDLASAIERDKLYGEKLLLAVRQIPGFEGVQTLEDAQRIMERNIEETYRRGLANGGAEWADWYPLGNEMGKAWAEAYNVHPDVAYAITARLSPQADWYDNILMAEEILKYMHEDRSVSGEDAQLARALIDDVNSRRKVPLPKSQLPAIEEGVSLSEQDPVAAGYIIRALSQATEVRNADPNIKGGEGGLPRWQSEDNLGKAIEIWHAGRTEQWEAADVLLGDEMKIRSFYNNLRTPDDAKFREVTIDTHAAGVAVGIPLTSKSHEITTSTMRPARVRYSDGTVETIDELTAMNFLGKPAAMARAGVKGVYPLMADAYRAVGDRLGVPPRAVQSVTWEQWRIEWPEQARSMWMQDTVRGIRQDLGHNAAGDAMVEELRVQLPAVAPIGEGAGQPSSVTGGPTRWANAYGEGFVWGVDERQE